MCMKNCPQPCTVLTYLNSPYFPRRLAYENVKDIIAVGFDLKKTFIFSDLDYIQVIIARLLISVLLR